MESTLLGLILDSSAIIAAERKRQTVDELLTLIRQTFGEIPGYLGLREHEGNTAMLLAGRPHGDFDILPKGGQEIHQALNREVAGLPTHQTGNVRLPDAQYRASLGLGESTVLDKQVDPQR